MLSSFKYTNEDDNFTVFISGKVFIKIKKKLLFTMLSDKLSISIFPKLRFSNKEMKTYVNLITVNDNVNFKIYYNKKLLLIANKSLIKKLFNKYFYKEDEDNSSKVNQFIKYYLKEYRRVTKRKFVPDYENDKNSYKYFVQSVELMNKHKVSFKIFLDSQIEKMNFVKQKNFFPRPYNLCTNETELRLLDYMDNLKDKNTNMENNFFDIDDIDLKNNKKYQKYLNLIKTKEANFEQANYVFSLQHGCLDKVDEEVKDYYNSF